METMLMVLLFNIFFIFQPVGLGCIWEGWFCLLVPTSWASAAYYSLNYASFHHSLCLPSQSL